MQPSTWCFDIAKRYELCRLRAYWDAKGQCWTIGWGHTGSDVREGLVWTQEEADAALEADLQRACTQMLALTDVQLTQGQLDALTDFVFNLGSGRYQTSTLRRDLNQGFYKQAAEELLRWDMAGGEINATLQKRRADEKARFES